jgi:hypothetical protein
MKLMTFNYHKTKEATSSREFIPFSKPNHNYFGLDISELDDFEVDEVVAFLAKSHQKFENLLKERTLWLNGHGYGSYFRNFSKEKMDNVTTEDLN